MPVDETRYMTVAWEMFINKSYFLLTLNFEAYHHKPPLLFWLINLSWNLFGVSRSTALLPIFVSSALVLVLSNKIAQKVYPAKIKLHEIAPWLLLGSLPFLVYSTLVMFDTMMTACVMGCFLLFLLHCEKPKWTSLLGAGLCLGLGVLIKGPVAYLYVLLPMLLYPLWKTEKHNLSVSSLYKSVVLSLLLSFLPVCIWLIPALIQADKNFAYWILWEQTAGRIKGDFNSAHVRPFYYYFLFLPAILFPWIVNKDFFKSIKHIKIDNDDKFLVSIFVPVFICFCFVAGKQPHYLLPLLPILLIFLGNKLDFQSENKIKHVSLIMCSIMIAINAIGSMTFFKPYDLLSVAKYYQDNKEKDFTFVGKYQGEIGFLARVTKRIDTVELGNLGNWFGMHPEGRAVIVYRDKQKHSKFDEIYTTDYRSKKIGILKEK